MNERTHRIQSYYPGGVLGPPRGRSDPRQCAESRIRRAERRRGTIAKGAGPAAGIGRRSGRRPQFHRETTGQILGALTMKGCSQRSATTERRRNCWRNSLVGPSRRFAVMQQYVGYRGHSGLWQAVRPARLWVHGLNTIFPTGRRCRLSHRDPLPNSEPRHASPMSSRKCR
jgi:hypothetical protein